MPQATLLPDLLLHSALARPQAVALSAGGQHWLYADLARATEQAAAGLMHLGLQRGARVAIFLEKRMETVVASLAISRAGGVFVPVNPLLKPEQVRHILRDGQVGLLLTSASRLQALQDALADCPDLRHLILCDAPVGSLPQTPLPVSAWADLLGQPPRPGHRVIDSDLAALFYTSGSTGRPKGVMLSHRNLVAGAVSVASYLGHQADDRLLAALPLSFDAGFSQLTTAFVAGARVVLLNYLLPRDVLQALERERITGLTAVPPLYLQLLGLDWPEGVGRSLRYFANTGGPLPHTALVQLRARLPQARPYLMYGLTEAFRSTYLPPEELDRHPGAIGRAIPNAEVLVLRDDGKPCAPDEPGELVHRGPLVALGYWGDPEKTAERFRPLPPGLCGQPAGRSSPEMAVFSGDTVRQDADGVLYFVGRRDAMIKTSGYRVSPTEVEEAVYATGLVEECMAFGVPHAELGQVIHLIATHPCTTRARGQNDLIQACRSLLPAYMLPRAVTWRNGPLPRNANGKIDRAGLSQDWLQAHAGPGADTGGQAPPEPRSDHG